VPSRQNLERFLHYDENTSERVAEISQKAGVSRATVYRWRQDAAVAAVLSEVDRGKLAEAASIVIGYARDAAEVLHQVAMNPAEDAKNRVKAAIALLERAGVGPVDEREKSALNLTFLQQVIGAATGEGAHVEYARRDEPLPDVRSDVFDVEPSPLPAATQSGRAEPLPTGLPSASEARLVSPEAAEAARRWRAIVEARRGGKR